MPTIRRDLNSIVGGTRGRDTINLFVPPAWTTEALCAETDPELFFPEKGGTTSRAAKRVCAACPVIDECLEYALAYESGQMGTSQSYSQVGVYGGKSPRERIKILRERNGTDAA